MRMPAAVAAALRLSFDWRLGLSGFSDLWLGGEGPPTGVMQGAVPKVCGPRAAHAEPDADAGAEAHQVCLTHAAPLTAYIVCTSMRCLLLPSLYYWL